MKALMNVYASISLHVIQPAVTKNVSILQTVSASVTTERAFARHLQKLARAFTFRSHVFILIPLFIYLIFNFFLLIVRTSSFFSL